MADRREGRIIVLSVVARRAGHRRWACPVGCRHNALMCRPGRRPGDLFSVLLAADCLRTANHPKGGRPWPSTPYPGGMSTWRRIPRNDMLPAIGLATLAVFEALTLHHHQLEAALLMGAMATSLIWRRRPWVPVVTIAVLLPTMVEVGISLNAAVSIVIMVVIAAYSAGSQLGTGWAAGALAVLLAGEGPPCCSTTGRSPPISHSSPSSAAVPWGFGVAMRARHRYVAVLEERAELLERDREGRAQVAVAEERARVIAGAA